jgi:hypothetical protein
MMATNIQLLRKVVGAKVAYWQALRALETATAPNGDDWSDKANDAVIESIDDLAVGCDTPGDTKWIKAHEVDEIMALVVK